MLNGLSNRSETLWSLQLVVAECGIQSKSAALVQVMMSSTWIVEQGRAVGTMMAASQGFQPTQTMTRRPVQVGTMLTKTP